MVQCCLMLVLVQLVLLLIHTMVLLGFFKTQGNSIATNNTIMIAVGSGGQIH